jgi:hypothetical protein
MKKQPPRSSRQYGLLASPRVVRIAALYAEHFFSNVPSITKRATRRWRKSKSRVKKFFRWLLLILLLNIIGWLIASRI